MAVLLNIEPFDTLFFRDSRPFTAGEDDLAESTLPSALTMYGAIGSYYLENHNHILDDFIKDFITTKLGKYSPDINDRSFTIKGPFLCFDGKPYFSAPANLWVYGNGKSPLILKPQEYTDGRLSDIDEGLLPVVNHFGGKSESFKGYLSLNNIETYLSDKKEPWRLNPKDKSDFYDKEVKTGHQIDPISRTVKKGMLYSSRHLRFRDTVQEQNKYKKASLMVIIDSFDVNDFIDKTYCIGGERRGAIFEPVEVSTKLVPESENVLKKICDSKRFFIYLVSLAIFAKGWHRDWPSPDFDDAQMVGAAVNKPQYISGWVRSGIGMRGHPRHIKRCVPAGSVYFFKADHWDENRFKSFYQKYHFNESLSDEYPSAGFGTALIGVW